MALTSSSYTVTTFTHESLILGHTYIYRVTASNLMGFGAYSASYSFIPRSVPTKPLKAPINVQASTTRTTLFVSYDKIWDDGGAPILNYNIYIDGGNNGTTYTGPIANGPTLLTWNSGALTLVTGRTYQVKYSATNIHGEGPTSDIVRILLAVAPSAPSNLQRIDMNSLTAGDIRVKWQLPADNGGSPVNGYRLYLNDVLLVDASTQSTLNSYTYTGLSVGQTYLLSISAVNNIGESPKASLSLLAASVP